MNGYALALGDDALILSHRLSEWISRAPELEEDMALANIALDLLGQARALLAYAGADDGRDEDRLAYFRDEREFRNLQLVELDNGDFAVTMARQLAFSAYQFELYSRLSGCADATLAAIAAKAVNEVAYHRDHATQWVLRLGDGTAESHRRMVAGLEAVWPYLDELFEPIAPDGLVDSPEDLGPGLRPAWESHVYPVLRAATLPVPPESAPGYRATGGRNGVHTEALGYLLAEMQHLARSHPEATW